MRRWISPAPEQARSTCRRGPRGSDIGAAAVEAGLVTTFLAPLMVGILCYGSYFWHAQHVDAYTARIPQDGIVGEYTCAELITRVESLALGAAANLGDGVGPALTLDDITVEVVRVLPTVGVDVRLHVAVPVVPEAASFLPLPHDGAVVSDVLTRLENVSVTTESC